ncbi:MAG: DUF1800 domain-containing protein [Steroidobacteraceae bacterium]
MALRVAATTLLLLGALTACGGGGGSGSSAASATSPTATARPISRAEAFSFLNQASFGATESTADRLISLGDSNTAYARWIDLEIAKPASLLLPTVEAAVPNPIPTGFVIGSLNATRQEAWFTNVLRGDDQLRQRVAFALSEIFVVSQVGALQNLPFATASFHDLLARSAFGNYRQLLEDVTLHPAMGIYLSMLGNQRAVTGTNLRPDENYAREMMQLFSIGLVELNTDGSTRLDSSGQPIPTYNQEIIEGFARVFTGWKWACPTGSTCTFANVRPQLVPTPGYNQIRPMQLYSEQHETGSKRVLSNTTIPANQAGAEDLRLALDNVFNHPNVGPFISKQLIQRLVTSNPSPQYVRRVAETFNSDSSGQRGNLGAVIRAILLDPEARSMSSGVSMAYAGKLKEPLLRLTQFWRAYDAISASGRLGAGVNFTGGVGAVFGQAQGSSPSVFNFFSPFYAPPGEIAESARVAPEMQIATEYLNTQITNFFWTQASARTQTQAASLNPDLMFINTGEELALAATTDALIDRVAKRLFGSADAISPALRAEVLAQIDRTAVPTTNPANALATRTADAIYLLVTSSEFALQR